MNQKPGITWKTNNVVITYQDTELSYEYSSLPDTDLLIPGLDLKEFNQMVERVREKELVIIDSIFFHEALSDSGEFIKNFKPLGPRNSLPAGYQRCRALAMARMYPDSFNIMSKSFCIFAYRYILDEMGSIDEVESLYKDLRGFKEFNDPHLSKFNYRWATSVLTALAHCYVKAGDGKKALNIFNKTHSFGDITLWPGSIVNAMGACYVTNQSVEYSRKIYETALHAYDIKSAFNVTDIIRASEILRRIMGKDNNRLVPLYEKANDLLKKHI